MQSAAGTAAGHSTPGRRPVRKHSGSAATGKQCGGPVGGAPAAVRALGPKGSILCIKPTQGAHSKVLLARGGGEAGARWVLMAKRAQRRGPSPSPPLRSVLVAGAVAHLCYGQALGPLDWKVQHTAPHCAPRVGGRAGAGRRQAPPPAGAPGWVLRGGRRLAGSSLRAPAPARGPRWLAW